MPACLCRCAPRPEPKPHLSQGIIVTQADDTVYCLVPLISAFPENIPIKRSADGELETFPLSRIRYLANGSNVYENVAYRKDSAEVHKLMWLEEEGALTLYLEVKTRVARSDRFGQGGFDFFGEPDMTYVLRKNGVTYLVEKTRFADIVRPLIADNPELLEKLEKGRFQYDKIEELVRKYNKATAGAQ